MGNCFGYNKIKYALATEEQLQLFEKALIEYIETCVRHEKKFRAFTNCGSINVFSPAPNHNFYNKHGFLLKDVPEEYFTDVCIKTIKKPFIIDEEGVVHIAKYNINKIVTE
jgi:hypothetical protein